MSPSRINRTKRLSNKSLKSLVSQLGYCHSIIRKCEKPLNTIVTGLGPVTKSILELHDYEKWLLNFTDKNYTDLFDKSKLVYLSGDAEEEMGDFDKEQANKCDIHHRWSG